jgi:hypothetical protein
MKKLTFAWNNRTHTVPNTLFKLDSTSSVEDTQNTDSNAPSGIGKPAELMNREAMIELIFDLVKPLNPSEDWSGMGLQVQSDDLTGLWGPFSSTEHQEAFLTVWLEEAPFEWVDFLLDIIIHPPQVSSHVSDEFYYHVTTLLGLLGRKNPTLLLEKVQKLLFDPSTRKHILDALFDLRSELEIPYFLELLNHADSMSKDELTSFYDAVCGLSSQTSKNILLALRPYRLKLE